MAQIMYFMIAVLVVVTTEAADTTLQRENNECPSLTRIETSLANLTSQFKTLPVPSAESSLTSVTSLLQLSLLREILNEYKKESTGNGSNEGIAILQRIELILNTSIVNIGERLDVVENNMHAMETRILSAVKKNNQLLLNHSNLTQTTLDQLDEKLDPEIETSLLCSCAEVLKNSSSSSSGYYTLADANGHPRKVYCHMGSLCNSGGGWNRVSILNMKNSNEKCPTGLRTYHQNGARACGRPVSSGGSCAGVIFPANFEYSQVCGKVIGYQKGQPDGSYSMDGIRLTHGNSQSHIWSFLASGFEIYSYFPCSSPAGRPVLSYVGSDYYGESGNPGSTMNLNSLFTSDRLWDGQNCGSKEEACCKRALIPWFHKKLGYTTTDYIEMRFCFNEGTHDEDSPVEEYEIYVK